MNSEQPSATSDQPSADPSRGREHADPAPDAASPQPMPRSMRASAATLIELRTMVAIFVEEVRNNPGEDIDEVLEILATIPGLTREHPGSCCLVDPCPVCDPYETLTAQAITPEPSPQTIRREIATACLAGILANVYNDIRGYTDVAEEAVKHADGLIAALRTIPDPNAESPS